MKKFLAVVLSLFFVFSLSACKSKIPDDAIGGGDVPVSGENQEADTGDKGELNVEETPNDNENSTPFDGSSSSKGETSGQTGGSVNAPSQENSNTDDADKGKWSPIYGLS